MQTLAIGRSHIFRSLRIAAASALVAFGLPPTTRAASGTWNGTQSALWTNSANWSVSPYPSGGDTATFAGTHGLWVDAKGGTGDPEPRLGWTELGSYTVQEGTAGTGGSGAASASAQQDRDADQSEQTHRGRLRDDRQVHVSAAVVQSVGEPGVERRGRGVEGQEVRIDAGRSRVAEDLPCVARDGRAEAGHRHEAKRAVHQRKTR